MVAAAVIVIGGWGLLTQHRHPPLPPPRPPAPLAPGVDPFALPEAERQALIDRYGLDPNTLTWLTPSGFWHDTYLDVLVPTMPPLAAISDDGETAVFEQSINWQERLQPEGFDFGVSRMRAATFNGMFGSRMRMIFMPEGTFVAFPERSIFFSATDLITAMGDEALTLNRDDFITEDILLTDLPAELFTTHGMNRMPMSQMLHLLDELSLFF